MTFRFEAGRYWTRWVPGHPRGPYVREHVLVAEQALGHHLPDGAEVHHVNGIRSDSRPTNLVICQDRAYHFLLHRHLRVLRAGGNPHRDVICSSCRLVKDKSDFSPTGRTTISGHCRECHRVRERLRRIKGNTKRPNAYAGMLDDSEPPF